MNKTVAALIGLVVGAGAGVGVTLAVASGDAAAAKAAADGTTQDLKACDGERTLLRTRETECNGFLYKCKTALVESRAAEAPAPAAAGSCCLDAAKLEQQRDEARADMMKESRRRLDAESSFRECELNLLVLKSK